MTDSKVDPRADAFPPTPMETAAHEILGMMYGVMHVFKDDEGHPSASLVGMAEEKFHSAIGASTFRPDDQGVVYEVEALVVGALAQVGNERTAEIILAALAPKLSRYAQDMERPSRPAINEAHAPIIPAVKIDRFTPIQTAGKVATDALLQATYDTQNLLDVASELISEVDTDSDTMQPCTVLRAIVAQIHAMNSVQMSYFGGEDLGVAHLYREVHGRVVGERALEREIDALSLKQGSVGTDAAFGAGLRLARAMLEEAKQREEDPSRNDASEPKRWMRGGAAIDAFAQSYLLRVKADPTLLEGFAAGLSCALIAGVCMHPSELAVPIGEFRAGGRGEDGTDPGESDMQWKTERPMASVRSRSKKPAAVAEGAI